MSYSIPRDMFLLLEAAFNHDREKAEVFAKAIEGSIQAIENQADERITHKKETLKSELYNELRGARNSCVRRLVGFAQRLVKFVQGLSKMLCC
jgi:hypothetical protein